MRGSRLLGGSAVRRGTSPDRETRKQSHSECEGASEKKGQPDEFSDAIPLRGRDLDQAEYRQIVADEKQSTGRARRRESTDILRAAMRAIEEPEVAALAEEGDCHRREVIDGLTRRWAAKECCGRGSAPRPLPIGFGFSPPWRAISTPSIVSVGPRRRTRNGWLDSPRPRYCGRMND